MRLYYACRFILVKYLRVKIKFSDIFHDEFHLYDKIIINKTIIFTLYQRLLFFFFKSDKKSNLIFKICTFYSRILFSIFLIL